MARTFSSCAQLLITTFLLLALAEAKASFSLAAKTNVVVYYGQGPNQKEILQYCKEPSIDVIVLSFIHLFPAQANGYPGSNFGNQCRGAVYAGPGRDRSKNALQADCPILRSQLATCQGRYGKKVLLSLGGGTAGYQLTGAAAGRDLADQLWAMFGPRDPASRLPRPFDAADLDGFDLDIEHPPTDGGTGYRALASRLRAHFASPRGRQKPRFLTASPQCVVPDANLSAVIRAVRFDALFIQFYNTQTCSAARWAQSNPSFTPTSGKPPSTAGFTFDDWARHLGGTPSQGARLPVGLPGGARGAGPGQYIPPEAARRLIEAYYCRPQFGGVAVWDATHAAPASSRALPFYSSAKDALVRASADGRLRQCPLAPKPAAPSSPNPGACGTSHPKCPSPLCCSKYGYCGQSATYCGAGCQRAFGICS